jgi:hypothetical protein
MELRERLKSVLVRVPGGNALLRWRRGALLRERLGATKSAADTFTRYFETGKFDGTESLSGPGSSIAYTEPVRRELPPLLAKLGVKVLLDAPCGDYHWFKLLRPQLACRYIGADIVPNMIDANQAKHGDATTSFVRLDITTSELPRADLWLCRDVLFHLSEADIWLTLDNFLRSGIPYLLATSHPECRYNSDIPTGSCRMVNLELAPYRLPPPREKIADWVEGSPVRYLCLWTRAEVEQARNRRAWLGRLANLFSG